MRYLLCTLILLGAAIGASAQTGAIRQTTPTTFTAPSTIQDWDPKSLHIIPGPAAQILVEIVARNRPDVTLTFNYPTDCGSFGTDASGQPNPPACPNRDTSAEIDALISTLNKLNFSGANQSLWQRVFNNICADFPGKFPGGCTVQ